MAKATHPKTSVSATNQTPKTTSTNGGNGRHATNGPDLSAMVQSSEAWLKGMTDLGAEMVTFTTHRMQESVRISEAFSQCKDFNEALEVQRDFMQHASEEYLQEANKIMALTAEMTRAAWSPLQDQATETVSRLTGTES